MDSKFFITGRINSARQPDGSELIFPKLKHGGKLIIVPMDISKFPEFPQWVGFFESMDDFADKVRLFWKRNDRIRAKLKKKEARKLQAKAIAEKKVSKKDLEKVIAEISKVIDMQTDPEEFKDQVTSIVRKSKMKSKTAKVNKSKTTRSVVKDTNAKVGKIDTSQIKQPKVDHEPDTIPISGKNLRDQTDSDNESTGHKSKRQKAEDTVTSPKKQSIRTTGNKCPRVESDSDIDPIENGPKRQKAKPPDGGAAYQQESCEMAKQKVQTSKEEALIKKMDDEFDELDAFMDKMLNDPDYCPSDHGSDTDVSDSDSDMCDYLSDSSFGI